MKSYQRDSSHFWVEKICHIYQVLNSMHEHGGFALVCSYWSRAAKEECVAELDQLIGILHEWKRQLEVELTGPKQPAPLQVSRGAPPRAAHLRVASPVLTARR